MSHPDIINHNRESALIRQYHFSLIFRVLFQLLSIERIITDSGNIENKTQSNTKHPPPPESDMFTNEPLLSDYTFHGNYVSLKFKLY